MKSLEEKKLDIFLDTNIIYKDPFFQRGRLIILRELAKADNVKIHINEAVLSEVRRGYTEYIQNSIKEFDYSIIKLNRYISNSSDIISSGLTLDYFLNQFDRNINSLVDNGVLNITPYYKEVVSKIVEIDMDGSLPFIKSKNDKSIRDAVIWYSYIQYIDENQISNAYFLSHNTKDFAQDHKEAQKKENNSYTLNSSLKAIPFKSAHKSCEDFIDSYEDDIQIIFKENDIDVLSQSVLDSISEYLKSQNVISNLEKKIISPAIDNAVFEDVGNLVPPPDIDNLYSSGYVDHDGFDGEIISDITIQEVASYGGRLIVELILTYSKDLDVFIYNAIRDRGDDYYTSVGSIPMHYEISCNLTWPVINHIAALKDKNFSLEDIINVNEPEDILVEFIEKNYQIEYPEFDDGLDLTY